ncbi:ammonium transporter [Mariniblastus fucicola]|uniref:Ammonium transporter n=1 Tax=Mariniblastus fucicola TaxID=980251 RepID=A0A5B9P525_9BACT|nr:ammonium transporter [Mariniblastus fucicola]QEG20245.1 Ammonium transporter NrgA [Mariniblastus fucicola]
METNNIEMVAESLQTNMNFLWVAICAALVFFMQAGFAMLESGMVRSKNAINVIMKNYTDMCFGALVFWAVGYGIMFGTTTDGWGLFGTDGFMAEGEPWDYMVMMYQMMFAATAATIVSGALAERIRFGAYVLVAILITAFVYPVFGCWVWNEGGWLAQMGFIDFAGSSVVHSVGGWCALAGLVVLGPRLGRFGEDGEVREIGGHNLPLVAFGGMILWFGWFGFNGGSTLAADGRIGEILLNTHLAGSAGVVGFVLTKILFLDGKLLMTDTVNGGLAGLVGITAGCATMSPAYAVATGLAAGVICVAASAACLRWKWDDAVGAVAVHGVCGAWGTLAAGLFLKGDMYNWDIVSVQLIGIAACAAWTFTMAWTAFKVVSMVIELRVSTTDEQRGLDFSEHHEVGYPEFQATLHN